MRKAEKAKRPAAARLRSRRGESLGEVLIAVLIAALGLVILAATVRSAARIVRESKAAAEEYVKAESALVSGTGSDGSGTVSVYVDGGTEPCKLTDVSAQAEIEVDYHKNSVLSNKPVISYEAN